MNLQYVDNPKTRYESRAERGSTEEHLTTYQQGRARDTDYTGEPLSATRKGVVAR